MQQAEALWRRDLAAVGWNNVIEEEEIEDVGGRHADRPGSQYARAIEHLLKLQYRRPGESEPVAGWRRSVNQARSEIEDVLRRNPGLKGQRDEVFDEAWPRARQDAISVFVDYGTGVIQDDRMHLGEQKRLMREWNKTLPEQNPYTRQQVEEPFWMPEQVRLAQRPRSRHQPARPFDRSR